MSSVFDGRSLATPSANLVRRESVIAWPFYVLARKGEAKRMKPAGLYLLRPSILLALPFMLFTWAGSILPSFISPKSVCLTLWNAAWPKVMGI